MYKNRKDFEENIGFTVTDTDMVLKSVVGEFCHYHGKLDDGNMIYMHVSMNNKANSKYYHYENVTSLLDSDNVYVYMGSKCILVSHTEYVQERPHPLQKMVS